MSSKFGVLWLLYWVAIVTWAFSLTMNFRTHTWNLEVWVSWGIWAGIMCYWTWGNLRKP
jgi:hypothetical protein